MYNAHRAMGPGPGPQQPADRLNELLQQVRAEFEQQAGRSTEHEHQCKSNQPYGMENEREAVTGTTRGSSIRCRAERSSPSSLERYQTPKPNLL